ncbi:MAG: glycosyltransferase [Acidobacteria bacterium]|nr:glycosyltransferase [Acidobacteriota bacterium]
MINFLHVAFWFCILVPAYVFVGYPALLALGALFYRRSVRTASDYEPTVSILIAAYNEEANIERSIRSALNQDYPAEKLEVIVGSDGSTDRTGCIVAEWCCRDKRVRLLDLPRAGKAMTDNALVAAARGEIIVATSAFAFAEPAWVRNIVRVFSDSGVGCVTSHARMVNSRASGVSAVESSYFQYEFFLRNLETKLGILCVSNGASNSFRRSLYQAIPAGGDLDNLVPLHAVAAGYRVVHEPDAWVYEEVIDEQQQQLRARTRQISKSLRDILRFSTLLNPLKHPRTAVVLWSHRLLRWGTPLFLVVAFVLNAALALSGGLYAILFFVQLTIYVVGWVVIRLGKRFRLPGILSLVGSFVTVNIAMTRGMWNVFTGHEIRQWRE